MTVTTTTWRRSPSWHSAIAPRASLRSSRPPASHSRTSGSRRSRSSSSSRTSRSPAMSGRSCAARMGPVPTRSSPPRRGPISPIRTSSAPAPGRSSRSRWPRPRPLRSSTGSRSGDPHPCREGRWGATVHRRRPDRPGGARRRCRGRGPWRRLALPGHRGHPPPDGRHRRQPERVGHGGCAPVRGAPAARPSCRPVQTDAMSTSFDFVVIGAGTAGEAAANKARELGATVAIVDSAGSAAVARMSAASRRRPCSTRPRARQEPGRVPVATGLVAARLHGEPRRRCRRARRPGPCHGARRGRGRRLPRRGPDHGPRHGRDPPRRRAARTRRPRHVVVAVGSHSKPWTSRA